MKKFISTKNVESTSDHDLIKTAVKTKGNVNISETTFSRNLNRLNIESYKMDLLSQKWSNVYNFTEVDDIASKITKIVTNTLDLHIPRAFKIRKYGKKSRKLSPYCLE